MTATDFRVVQMAQLSGRYDEDASRSLVVTARMEGEDAVMEFVALWRVTQIARCSEAERIGRKTRDLARL